MKAKKYIKLIKESCDPEEEIFCSWWTKSCNRSLVDDLDMTWDEACKLFDHDYHWDLWDEFRSFLEYVLYERSRE